MVVLAMYALTFFNPAWFLYSQPPVGEDDEAEREREESEGDKDAAREQRAENEVQLDEAAPSASTSYRSTHAAPNGSTPAIAARGHGLRNFG